MGRARATLRRLCRVAARRRVLRKPGVAIAPDAKVSFEKIALRSSSRISIGSGSIVDASIVFERDEGEVVIGCNTFVGASTLICAESINIGDDVLIAWGCTFIDHDSHSVDWETRRDDVTSWFQHKKDWINVPRASINIKSRSWIGLNTIILKGVTVGEGSVVGAGSVVTTDVPPNAVVAGNPARIIRDLTENSARGG